MRVLQSVNKMRKNKGKTNMFKAMIKWLAQVGRDYVISASISPKMVRLSQKSRLVSSAWLELKKESQGEKN